MKPSQLKITFSLNIFSSSICCPEQTYDFLMKIWDKDLMDIQEQVNILFLNGANEVISWRCFNTGTCNETLFDIKLVAGCAVTCLAAKIIVAHNHPSSILIPSLSDISITKKLKSACEILDITLSDHLIICRGGFYSFAENGLMRC